MGDFRTDRARYPAHRAHVKSARDRVRRVAFEWELPIPLISDLTLITSELFTNALLHAHPPVGREIGVTLVLTPECVRLEVRDAGGSLPAVQTPSDDDQAGRGLLLVAVLADRWDVITQVVGKTVFAEIDFNGSTPVGCKGVAHV